MRTVIDVGRVVRYLPYPEVHMRFSFLHHARRGQTRSEVPTLLAGIVLVVAILASGIIEFSCLAR